MPEALAITTLPKLPEIEAALSDEGFAYVCAQAMQAVLEEAGLKDWEGFAASWNNLGVDKYMADGGRYRRRRYAAFSLGAAGIRRKPHQPHYQSRDYNALNGGLARWFDPVLDSIASHPAMMAVLRTCCVVFNACTDPHARPASWHVEIHQFRIEARPDERGQPTPEGLHRDGVDWVLVLLVQRENVASGETSIHDLKREKIGGFTLTTPMEAAFVDDDRVFHGVTAIEPIADAPAYRDVLVVTFRRE